MYTKTNIFMKNGDKVRTQYGTIETVLSVTGTDVTTYESKVANYSWHITKVTKI